ncbi:MAG: hypothetical protein IJW06_02240 [Clostridia bacterium]|nr:hypothetical protein [Clostridia bacterium]
MKTKRFTALILSVLMIVSLLPTSVVALPSAVTVSDSAHEHLHTNEAHETATLSAIKTLEIKLYDSYGDGWNGASLSVYKGTFLVETFTIEDSVPEKAITLEDYNDLYSYSFVWTKGTYDQECSFEILIGGESVFATESEALSSVQDGDVIFTLESSCEHSIAEGTLVCSVCSLTCGSDFAHKFDENNICTICKTACGTQGAPHNWENKDGVCAICKAECTHSFADGECTVCGFRKEAYVVTHDGSTTYYLTLDEALEEAAKSENSTLFLNKNIDYNNGMLYISAGKFTFYFGDYTLNAESAICVNGTAELIIDGQGTLNATGSSACLIIQGSSKVTVKDGTFKNNVYVQGTGSTLTVEGGMFSSYGISIYDGIVTFSGITDSCYVAIYGGSLVFEDFEGIENITLSNGNAEAMDFSDITLPADYVICDALHLEIQEIEEGGFGYIVSKNNAVNPKIGLYISAFDSPADSWNEAKIEVYKVEGETEELVGTIEIADHEIKQETFELDYDMTSAYKFNWVSGAYDSECAFAIFVNEELKYKTYNCEDSFGNTSQTFLAIEPLCTGHEFENGSFICKNCSFECGKDFAHSFGDDHICDICSFECGTTDNPHSYEDGYCTVCKTECTHEFEDNVCSLCSVKRFYTVKTEEKTHFFENFQEAVLFAVENNESTLTLYRDVDLGENGLDIEIGDFTFDLNGFKITSSDYTLVVRNETLLTVCDSSKEKTGRIETTASDCAAICLHDYTMLTLQSGTVYGPHRAIVMDTSGVATQAVVKINGGKVISDDESSVAIKAHGDSVIINGGETRGIILHMTGTVDLSQHPNPAGIIIQNQTGDALPAYVYNLPDGCYFVDPDGETTDTIKESINYTVAGAPPVAIDVGARVNDTNFRYKVINGVRDSYAIPEEGTIIYLDVQEDTLIEIVEKASYDAVEVAKTQYFFVDAETRQVTKLGIDNYASMYDETQVRTTGNMGMRFMANIMARAKNEEENFVIDEYGFIVAAAYNLENATELTVNSPNFVQGVAFSREDNIDLIFNSDNDDHIVFAGVLVNVPVKNYKTDVVCRTYTKITVGTSQFIIYGEPVTGNIYDTAKNVLETIPDDAALQKIVDDYDNYVNGDTDSEVGVPSPEF